MCEKNINLTHAISEIRFLTVCRDPSVSENTDTPYQFYVCGFKVVLIGGQALSSKGTDDMVETYRRVSRQCLAIKLESEKREGP